eukprot:scaffold256745_cov55-Attheya_sp.AAC.4
METRRDTREVVEAMAIVGYYGSLYMKLYKNVICVLARIQFVTNYCMEASSIISKSSKCQNLLPWVFKISKD